MLVALKELAQRDVVMAAMFQRYGVPPMWARSQSFETLVHIILEQKVSIISAQAVMTRVCDLCPAMEASRFLSVPDTLLRAAGLSASKLSYCQSIAQAINEGSLDLASLQKLPDNEVIDSLTQIRGIGPWSAGVYVMMALQRRDAWASGDRALVVSYAQNAQLEEVPSYAQLDVIAQAWSPYRGTAARLLWHAYLCKRDCKQECKRDRRTRSH